MNQTSQARSVLITGAGGYIGRLTTQALAGDRRGIERILACDIRLPAEGERIEGVEHLEVDVRSPQLAGIMTEHQVDTVVHLAAVVNPGGGADRELLHSVEVDGTKNLLDCCLKAGVGRFIFTSSGAAYGYHPDNPEWLDEGDPLRGNPEFAYSDHKRQVEEMLVAYRREHPELAQLILRPGTILGSSTRNQITDLFDGKVVMGLSGSASPFVLIWDQDVVGAILQGVHQGGRGIYNLAGDGTLTLREMAKVMGKPYVVLPTGLVKGALWLLARLKLTQYGPEQVNFLRYRPVLANRRLKEEFGYIPRKSTRQVFDFFLKERGRAAA